jgi:hypothetical protein
MFPNTAVDTFSVNISGGGGLGSPYQELEVGNEGLFDRTENHASIVFVETLGNLQHSTQLIPESQGLTLNLVS